MSKCERAQPKNYCILYAWYKQLLKMQDRCQCVRHRLTQQVPINGYIGFDIR